MPGFTGPAHLDIARLTASESRAITAENATGARGAGARATEGAGAKAARDLGVGWKVSPSLVIGAGQRVELAAIEGPGVIRHLWLTMRVEAWRTLVLRMTWEGDEGHPAVALPVAVWVLTPHDLPLGVVTTALGALAIYKHKSNLRRLFAGTENRFGEKKEVPK